MRKRIFTIIASICVFLGILVYPFIPKQSSGTVMQLSQIKGWDKDNISSFEFYSGNKIYYKTYRSEPRCVRSYAFCTNISQEHLDDIIQSNSKNGLPFMIDTNISDKTLVRDDFIKNFPFLKSEIVFSKLASITINMKNRTGKIVIYYDEDNEVVYCKIYTSARE